MKKEDVDALFRRKERADRATAILKELANDIQHAVDVKNGALPVTGNDGRQIAKIARLIQDLV